MVLIVGQSGWTLWSVHFALPASKRSKSWLMIVGQCACAVSARLRHGVCHRLADDPAFEVVPVVDLLFVERVAAQVQSDAVSLPEIWCVVAPRWVLVCVNTNRGESV